MRNKFKNRFNFQMIVRHDKFVAALGLALLTAVFFYPVLFGGGTLLGRDFLSQFYGIKCFYRESILNGELPFWCPFSLSGSPLLSSFQHAVLYPLSATWIIFPTAYAYGIYAALHCWLFAWFLYLLARECRAGIAGSWVAACCGFASSTWMQFMEAPELLAGLTWLPLIMYFWLGLLRSGEWKKSVGLAFAGAMQVYAGSPYPLLMTLVCMFTTGVPFLLISKNRAPLKRILGRAAASAGLAFMLAAPQLFPLIEISRQIPPEFLSRDPQEQAYYSLLATDWLKSFVPTFHGFPMPGQHLYLGALAVMLIAAMLTLMFTKRWRWSGPATGMFVLAIAGIIMASGPFFQLHKVFALVPMISRLYKYPMLFVFLASMPLAVLAGLTVHPLRRLPIKTLWWLGGATAAVILLIFVAEPWLKTWAEEMRQIPRYLQDFKSFTARPEAFPILSAINRFLILLICALGATIMLTNVRRWHLTLAAITLLMLVDKAMLMSDMRLFGKINVYEVETPSMRLLREAGADKELARVHKTFHMMGETHIMSGSNEPAEFAWIRDFMPWSVGIARHFYQTNRSGTLNPPESEFIWERALDSFEPWQNDRLRGLSNAKWIMDVQRNEKGYSYQIRTNPQYMPRAWLTTRAHTVEDWRGALGFLLNKDFNPRGTALLYATPTEVPEILLKQAPAGAPITSMDQTSNTITIKATAASDAVLIVADSYYKWWRASVDGKPVRVFKVNMAQKAVIFPKGEHVVRMVCVPVSFYMGCGLLILGIPLAIFILYRGRIVISKQTQSVST